MSELFDKAEQLLNERHSPPVHTVAASLQMKSGEVISALNIDHFVGFVCAETAALTIAINQGYYNFEKVVAVRKNEFGEVAFANMCGKCRQIFHDYAPDIQVETSEGLKLIDELLPMAFTRQRDKIQSVLGVSNEG